MRDEGGDALRVQSAKDRNGYGDVAVRRPRDYGGRQVLAIEHAHRIEASSELDMELGLFREAHLTRRRRRVDHNGRAAACRVRLLRMNRWNDARERGETGEPSEAGDVIEAHGCFGEWQRDLPGVSTFMPLTIRNP